MIVDDWIMQMLGDCEEPRGWHFYLLIMLVAETGLLDFRRVMEFIPDYWGMGS